jgi:hypothetical protein
MQLPSRMMIPVPDAALFQTVLRKLGDGVDFEADIRVDEEAVCVLLKLGQDETVTSPGPCRCATMSQTHILFHRDYLISVVLASPRNRSRSRTVLREVRFRDI